MHVLYANFFLGRHPRHTISLFISLGLIIIFILGLELIYFTVSLPPVQAEYIGRGRGKLVYRRAHIAWLNTGP